MEIFLLKVKALVFANCLANEQYLRHDQCRNRGLID